MFQKKDKYYTPSIEEFHQGFRYEHNSHSTIETLADRGHTIWQNNTRGFTFKEWQNKDLHWNKEVFELDDWKPRIVAVLLQIKSDELRVKKLDNNDIEELGWEFDTRLTEETTRFKSNQFILAFGETAKKIRIVENETLIFQGIIKNYNELKNLMSYLNI